MQAFEAGAKSVNPKVKQLTTYVGDWNDIAKSLQAINGQIGQNSDVVLACGGFDHRSYAAIVVEASAEAGRIAVHRVVCAFDCATVIHPDGARAQIEGAITQGLSAAIHERITIDAGGVVETNFHAYPLLRFHEAPASIEVHFIDRPDARVSGVGESALPPVAPALANALFRATGHRLRELPLRFPEAVHASP